MVGAPFDDHYFGDRMYQCVFVFVLFVCVTVTMMINMIPSNCKTVDMFSSFFSLSHVTHASREAVYFQDQKLFISKIKIDTTNLKQIET